MIEIAKYLFDALFTSKLSPALGGLLLAWIGYRLATSSSHKQNRINKFNNAADKFCLAFTPELAALKMPALDENTDPHAILQPAINKHRTAVIEFKRFLGCIRKRQFDRAWDTYYTYDNTGKAKTDYLLKYSPGWTQKPVYECRELAITNIEELLKFAKHK